MGSKTLKRKKAHQSHCRSQVKKGLINQPNGLWAPAQMTKAMDRDMIAGYRLGGSKRRGKPRPAELEVE